MKPSGRKQPNFHGITHDLLKIIARDDELFLQFRKALGLTGKQFENYMEGVKQSRVATVCIVELLDGKLIGVVSFPDTPAGNTLAEDLFRELYFTHEDPNNSGELPPTAEDDCKACLEDGIYDDNASYQLLITHSIQ